MNIKSLLLGSAAALAVVSGAHAADAIVAAEPEPAEYVKVCDAVGTGYFYIPGSETCMKIGGLIRYDMKAGAAQGATNGWSNASRFQINISTQADTEYGALKTSGVIRFNNKNSSDSLDINEATISLGGLTVGQTDSLYTTQTGYAGNVIQDGDKVGYGPFDTQLLMYSFSNGGMTVAVSVENDPNVAGSADDDYTPNFVAGAGYSSDTFGVNAVVGYDVDAQAAGIKARLDASAGAISGFVMVGFDTDSTKTGNIYTPWNGDWAVWAGLSAKVSDNVSLNTQFAYDQAKDTEVSANAEFKVASGFTISPEIDYIKDGATGDQNWGAILRFNRKF